MQIAADQSCPQTAGQETACTNTYVAKLPWTRNVSTIIKTLYSHFLNKNDHFENELGHERVFNLDKPPCHAAVPLPFQKPLADVSGDALTAAAILTEVAELWRDVTGATGVPGRCQ